MHDVDALFGFVLAGLALTGSPGPANLSLAATGAAFGARGALACMAGIVVGMATVMAMAATGLVGMALALPAVRPVMLALAAGYFVYLAFRIATAPPLASGAPRHGRPSFGAGLLLSLANPKAYAAMSALFSGFVLAPEQPALDAAAKTIVLTTIIVAVMLAWIAGGAALTRHFRDARSNRIINVVFAALLVASLVFVLPL